MTPFEDVKSNSQINNFIRQTEIALVALKYTDHGFRHSNIVAERARYIAKAIGLEPRQQEIAAIAGYCHDMGNFMTRTYHHYFGAMLFHQIFQNDFEPAEMSSVMQAIANHDKKEMDFTNHIGAVLVLADKSDVNRSRVIVKDLELIKTDIHDRVNFATTENRLNVDEASKEITLTLEIETTVTPIMEYFEIFTERMQYCRTSAEHLGYKFGIVINGTKLL